MRTEISLPSDTLRELIGSDDDIGVVVARYYRTGEPAPEGNYACTFCGAHVVVGPTRILPLCAACDSGEFVAAAVTDTVPVGAGVGEPAGAAVAHAEAATSRSARSAPNPGRKVRRVNTSSISVNVITRYVCACWTRSRRECIRRDVPDSRRR